MGVDVSLSFFGSEGILFWGRGVDFVDRVDTVDPVDKVDSTHGEEVDWER